MGCVCVSTYYQNETSALVNLHQPLSNFPTGNKTHPKANATEQKKIDHMNN